MFQIRAEVYDIKTFRTYKYGNDTCRLCKNGIENMDHIMNECVEVRRNNKRVDGADEDEDNIRNVISRIRCFENRLERLIH